MCVNIWLESLISLLEDSSEWKNGHTSVSPNTVHSIVTSNLDKLHEPSNQNIFQSHGYFAPPAARLALRFLVGVLMGQEFSGPSYPNFVDTQDAEPGRLLPSMAVSVILLGHSGIEPSAT